VSSFKKAYRKIELIFSSLFLRFGGLHTGTARMATRMER